jgi:CHAD domain-containing protein
VVPLSTGYLLVFMAYRLKRNRPMQKELRRIVTKELEAAIAELRNDGSATETSVHEARKSIKKIRAAIRLMRDELGSSYKTDNRLLRDVGRSLSDLRDASVLVSSLDTLGARTQSSQTKACLKKLAAEFRMRQQQTVHDKHSFATVEAAARQLESFTPRVDAWPWRKKGFAALQGGCKRTLKRTREAFNVVQQDATPQHLHDWRKRVKDHWYVTRLLCGVWPDVTTSFERTLNDLETKLGDHHNLQVLAERIGALDDPDFDVASKTAVLRLVANEQNRLSQEAIKIGERVYAATADEEFRSIKQRWHEWRKG